MLKGITITSLTRGKGKKITVLFKGQTDLTQDYIDADNYSVTFGLSAEYGIKDKMSISTVEIDNYVMDGIITYVLGDVQGSIALKEES